MPRQLRASAPPRRTDGESYSARPSSAVSSGLPSANRSSVPVLHFILEPALYDNSVTTVAHAVSALVREKSCIIFRYTSSKSGTYSRDLA